MIDPASVMTAAARRAQSTLPTKARSEATISYRPPDLVPDNASDEDDSDDEAASQPLTMSPAEIRVIRRLSARSNVLPVIARADSLTDEMLAAVKDAVRTGLREAGLGFGVFDGKDAKSDKTKQETPRRTMVEFADERTEEGEENEPEQVNGHEEGESDDEESTEGEERQSRPVIKLRPARHRNPRSQTGRDIPDNASPDATDRESVANVRFSAHLIAKTDLSSLLPFALIAPGDVGRLRKLPESSLMSPSVQDPSEDGHTESINHGTSPHPHSVRNFAYLQGPPDDLKGVFTRKFRWGTVDVLDPNHCDFAALRTAVLSTHLKVRCSNLFFTEWR
jgi:Septin